MRARRGQPVRRVVQQLPGPPRLECGLLAQALPGISASLLPAALLITASPLALAIVFFSMAMFGHQFWSTIMQTLAADCFPRGSGLGDGTGGASGSFGAMLFNLAVGAMLNAFGATVPCSWWRACCIRLRWS